MASYGLFEMWPAITGPESTNVLLKLWRAHLHGAWRPGSGVYARVARNVDENILRYRRESRPVLPENCRSPQDHSAPDELVDRRRRREVGWVEASVFGMGSVYRCVIINGIVGVIDAKRRGIAVKHNTMKFWELILRDFKNSYRRAGIKIETALNEAHAVKKESIEAVVTICEYV